jgi:hypothetical protein
VSKHHDLLRTRLAELPEAPAWLRHAGWKLVADHADFTDPEALGIVVGRPLTAAEFERVRDASSAHIQVVSEVLETEGVVVAIKPEVWPPE